MMHDIARIIMIFTARVPQNVVIIKQK